MTLYNSHLLLLLLIIPIIIGIFVAGHLQKKKRLAKFVREPLWHTVIPGLSQTRRFWKKTLVILGTTLVLIAVLRPQYGIEVEKVTRKGTDIMIAVDTSLSMAAQDGQPSRLDKAKQEIKDFITHLQGDRIGLIAFSGTAFVLSPLTVDYSAVNLFLDDLQVGMISRPGTNLTRAIGLAQQSFGTKKRKNKVLIILTDGESFSKETMRTAKKASQNGIRIFTIGLGTTTGEPIPVFGRDGRIERYKKDQNGTVILSKLDAAMLQKIAQTGNGAFFHSDGTALQMSSVYKSIARLEKDDIQDQLLKRKKDRYQIPLGIAFCLLLGDTALNSRSRRKK